MQISRIDSWARFAKPIEIVAWAMVVLGLVGVLVLPLRPENKQLLAGVVAAGILYILIFYHWLLPHYSHVRLVSFFRWLP